MSPLLPDHFDCKTVRWYDSEHCMLCKMEFGIFKRKHHCRRCGRCCCSECTQNKRMLSKSDKSIFRICDLCDTKIENFEVRLPR